MRCAVGVEREGDVDLVERAGALEGEVDRRGALDPQQGRDDAALRLVQVEVDVELARRVREAGREGELAAGAVAALDVEPGVERAAGEVERAGRATRSAAWPKTLSSKLTLSNCSCAIWIDTGSSGRGKGLASACFGRRLAGCAGISARRSQAMRPALSRLTATRPRSSASRLQSSSTLSISSQAPRASEMVTRWIRARDDSAPETPEQADLPAGRRKAVLEEVEEEAVVAVLRRVLGERGDRHQHQQRSGVPRAVSKRLSDADVEGHRRIVRVRLERRRQVEAEHADAGEVAHPEAGAGLEGGFAREARVLGDEARCRRSRPRRSGR